MINKIEIGVPYPLRVGFFSLNRHVKVTLQFDNLSKFMFMENNNISNNVDFSKFQKENENSTFFAEAVWAAVQSYCMHNTKKIKLNKRKFLIGFAQLPKGTILKVTEVWQRSQTFGAEKIPGKKKATQKG